MARGRKDSEHRRCRCFTGGRLSLSWRGNFANGAVTAAMAYAFNHLPSSKSRDAVRLGLSDRNAQGGYGSPEGASEAQHLAYDAEYQATNMNEELVGYIASRTIDGNERFFFSDMTKTSSSFDFDIIPYGPTDMNVVMISHTHPARPSENQELFSRRDARSVGTVRRNPGIPMNVRTPSGDLRYLAPEISTGVRAQAGIGLCSQAPCLPPHRNN